MPITESELERIKERISVNNLNAKNKIKSEKIIAERAEIKKSQKQAKKAIKMKAFMNADKYKYLLIKPTNYAKFDYIIGIDTGLNTGIAVYCNFLKCYTKIETVQIHQAIMLVANYAKHISPNILVRIEDARLRTWYGNKGNEVAQGVGSIKRDAVIWQNFLEDFGIYYELVAPKDNKTKLSEKEFISITGVDMKEAKGGKSSKGQHARDAAMLIYNLS